MGEVGGRAPATAPAAEPQTAAQDPHALSAAALGPTPVSGALEGNPPPVAPPAPPQEPVDTAEPGTPSAATEGLPHSATPAPDAQPTTVEPAAAAPDQPTQAFPAGGEPAPSNGDGHASSPVTSGDPLAQRERPDA
jgi:hypothetical protein